MTLLIQYYLQAKPNMFPPAQARSSNSAAADTEPCIAGDPGVLFRATSERAYLTIQRL